MKRGGNCNHMTKFKVDDRVAIYDSGTRIIGKVFKSYIQTVDVLIDPNGDTTLIGNYMYQQLRRLKKKEKPKPREIWVPKKDHEVPCDISSSKVLLEWLDIVPPDNLKENFSKFIEVLE